MIAGQKGRVLVGVATIALAAGAASTSALAKTPLPRKGVVYDCAFPTFVGHDYEQGGLVFKGDGTYRYGTRVSHRHLAGSISSGRYRVRGKTKFDVFELQFSTGPQLLRPERDDDQTSFVEPGKPDYVGVWAANAIDAPWDCYQVGTKDWKDREKQQHHASRGSTVPRLRARRAR